MTQTVESFNAILQQHLEEHRAHLRGYRMFIPILTPEGRERRAWNDAVAWLKQREATRKEWPWP